MNGHIIFLITFRIILGGLIEILFSSNDAARHRGTGLGDIANTPFGKAWWFSFARWWWQPLRASILPAFESMDGGCSNLQRQDSPAGHQGASNGEHSYDHVVDNQEHICEVHDRGIFGSDLALSEYGPMPAPAFGCQTRSIDINLATRRRRWAYNAGQEISVFVGCEQAECVIRR